MKTSPRAPFDTPSWNSSVFASYARTTGISCARKIVNRKTHLKVHVAISANKESLVFQPPFELHVYRLPSELLQERLRIERIHLLLLFTLACAILGRPCITGSLVRQYLRVWRGARQHRESQTNWKCWVASQSGWRVPKWLQLPLISAVFSPRGCPHGCLKVHE